MQSPFSALSEMLGGLGSDKLIILGVLWLLWNEHADVKLLLALIYIMLQYMSHSPKGVGRRGLLPRRAMVTLERARRCKAPIGADLYYVIISSHTP